jgi:hypothetical protein
MATMSVDSIGVVSIVPACVVRKTVAGESGHGYWMMDRHKNVDAKNMSMWLASKRMIESSKTAATVGRIGMRDESIATIPEMKGWLSVGPGR